MQSRLIVKCLILQVLLLPVFVNAHDEETLYNVVNLQAQAEREIPNNEMLVVLATEHQGNDPAEISKQINRDMQWALDIVKTYSDVDSKSGNYRTWPIYNKQIITGWGSSQQLELKSENMDSMTELTGKLQERLLVKQMTFRPTDNTRKQHENALIEEAMQAFHKRVKIIGKHMTQKNHRIVNIHINTGSSQPPVMFERAAMKTMAMDSGATPAVEAGESRISVTVSGSVQFF